MINCKIVTTPRGNYQIQLPEEYQILAEWGRLSNDQLNDGLDKLKLIKRGDLEIWEFGYDMTIYIYENDRSYLWYDYPKKEKDIDIDDILSLIQYMLDFRKYLKT